MKFTSELNCNPDMGMMIPVTSQSNIGSFLILQKEQLGHPVVHSFLEIPSP